MPRVGVCLTLLVSLSLAPVAASAQPGCVLGSTAGTFGAIPSTIRLYADESDVGTKRGKQGLTVKVMMDALNNWRECSGRPGLVLHHGAAPTSGEVWTVKIRTGRSTMTTCGVARPDTREIILYTGVSRNCMKLDSTWLLTHELGHVLRLKNTEDERCTNPKQRRFKPSIMSRPAKPNGVVSTQTCDDIRREMNGEEDPVPPVIVCSGGDGCGGGDGGGGTDGGGSGGIDGGGGGGGGGSGGLPSCATLPGGCPPPPPPEPDCYVAVCGGPPEQVPCDEDEEEI